MNMSKIKIYRPVVFDTLQVIESKGLIGNWSTDLNFVEKASSYMNKAGNYKGYVILSAEVTKDQIDENDTLFSINAGFNYNISLRDYLEIECRVEYVCDMVFDATTLTVNTDFNWARITDEYHGDMTLKDLDNLISEKL